MAMTPYGLRVDIEDASGHAIQVISSGLGDAGLPHLATSDDIVDEQAQCPGPGGSIVGRYEYPVAIHSNDT